MLSELSQNKNKEAQSNGYVTIDPTSVLITHVGQILNTCAAELLSQMRQDLLDNLEASHPNLVHPLCRK